MSDITFRSDVTVELVDSMGNDDSIVKAMLVSTQGADSLEAEASQGRIDFLMKNRHGTPFEHGSMTFYVEAPIFVFREFHRHRIGWSYNEISGRYRELDPVFYIPGPDRNLVQQGKPGHYVFVPGDEEHQHAIDVGMIDACTYATAHYQKMLSLGLAKEVARMVLPVNIFTAMYATANPRSIMAFLSLRTKRPPYLVDSAVTVDDDVYLHRDPGGSLFPSYPMREIEMVADKIEGLFAEIFPMTHASFDKHGRVSP